MADEAPPFDAAVPASRLALPRMRHVPGTGSAPDWLPLEQAKQLVPTITQEAEWADNGAYVHGFALMRGGYFWEAHEVWEPVWLACPPNGRARLLLRALIQAANAHLKREMNRPRAVVRLAREARQVLAELHAADGEAFMGVIVSRLSVDLCNLENESGDAIVPR